MVEALETMDRRVPKDLQIHLILDDYATHERDDVRESLDDTGSTSTSPTSSSS